MNQDRKKTINHWAEIGNCLLTKFDLGFEHMVHSLALHPFQMNRRYWCQVSMPVHVLEATNPITTSIEVVLLSTWHITLHRLYIRVLVQMQWRKAHFLWRHQGVFSLQFLKVCKARSRDVEQRFTLRHVRGNRCVSHSEETHAFCSKHLPPPLALFFCFPAQLLVFLFWS